MHQLISGNFQHLGEAERAVRDLQQSGFAEAHTATVVVGATRGGEPTPVDNDESNATAGALSGAGVGGAVGAAVGVVSAPVLGPAAAIAAVGIGAYAGSLYGTLNRLGGDDIPDAKQTGTQLIGGTARESGMWVAVRAATAEDQRRAISILRDGGATDIEQPEGTIVDGRWTDFDPLTPLRPVAATR
jgi:uncharacterized membrane protein